MSQKDEYIRTGEAQIKDWKAEIDRLRDRAGQTDPQKRPQNSEKVDVLQQKHQKSTEKLQEIKKADQGGWEALKEGFEKLRRDMQESIEEVKTTL